MPRCRVTVTECHWEDVRTETHTHTHTQLSHVATENGEFRFPFWHFSTFATKSNHKIPQLGNTCCWRWRQTSDVECWVRRRQLNSIVRPRAKYASGVCVCLRRRQYIECANLILFFFLFLPWRCIHCLLFWNSLGNESNKVLGDTEEAMDHRELVLLR